MSYHLRVATQSDFSGILDLQNDNLLSNLSAAELAGGFVTTPFTTLLLERLLLQDGVFVAVSNDKIVGYALAGNWEFFSQWGIFEVMMSRFSEWKFGEIAASTTNSFQYGPVCIDRQLRGTQAFPELFALMRSSFTTKYPLGVTFINQLNQRSYAAHTRKLGLEVVDEFEFNSSSFYTLAFLTDARKT